MRNVSNRIYSRYTLDRLYKSEFFTRPISLSPSPRSSRFVAEICKSITKFYRRAPEVQRFIKIYLRINILLLLQRKSYVQSVGFITDRDHAHCMAERRTKSKVENATNTYFRFRPDIGVSMENRINLKLQ